MQSPEEPSKVSSEFYDMTSSKEQIFAALEVIREKQIEDSLLERDYNQKRDALLYEKFFIDEMKLIYPNEAQRRANSILTSLYTNDGKYGNLRPESKIDMYMSLYNSHILSPEDTKVLVGHWENELLQITDRFEHINQINIFAFFTLSKEEYKQYYPEIGKMYYQLLPPFEEAVDILDSRKVGIFMGYASEAKRLGIEDAAFSITSYFRSLYTRGILEEMQAHTAAALFSELDIIMPSSAEEQRKKLLNASYSQANDAFVNLMTNISPELAHLTLEDAQKIDAFRQIATDWGFLSGTMGQLTKFLFDQWVEELQKQAIVKEMHMPEEVDIDAYQDSVERFELFAEHAVEKYLEQDLPEKAYQLFIRTVTPGASREMLVKLMMYALTKDNKLLLQRAIQEVQDRFNDKKECEKEIEEAYRSYLTRMAYSEHLTNLK